MAIQSFRCRDTEDLFHQRRMPAKFRAFSKEAIFKLQILDYAGDLNDLRVPPGNRLEALKGNRKGEQSIRINRQWRVCFKWGSNGPFNVKIEDYH